jgi:uncharacterized protein with HEPN domain
MRSMLSERARKALLDIRDNIVLAREWSAGFSHEAFAANRAVFYAVTRCLEVISEATRRLPPELTRRHPAVPWQNIRDAGNIYRHDYDGVQERIILETVNRSLDDLDRAVRLELDPDS